MDQNQNNNSSSSDPNGNLSGQPPFPSPSDSSSASPFPPPVSPMPAQPDLSTVSSPPPSADPVPPVVNPSANSFGSAAPAPGGDFASSPGFSAQPDAATFSPPPPPPPVEPSLPGNNNIPSEVPGWAVPPSPVPGSSSNDLAAGSGGFGGISTPDSGMGSQAQGSTDFGQSGFNSTPSPAEEPVPTFSPAPSALGNDSSTPSPMMDQTGLGAAVPGPEPSAPQFPPTWPPTPSAAGSFDTGASNFGEGGSGDVGPTDLSHLMNGSPAVEASPVVTPAAATVVSSQPAGSEASANPQSGDANSGASQVVTSSPSGGFPKWMLGVGALVLVVAIAASAYFILGVGSSSPEQQTSLPAEQPPLTNPPRTALPSPAAQPSPAATSSASFGNLQGSAPQTSTSSGQTSGGSALELLRQRQGR